MPGTRPLVAEFHTVGRTMTDIDSMRRWMVPLLATRRRLHVHARQLTGEQVIICMPTVHEYSPKLKYWL